ncbi:MAG: hypothetical protein AAF566_05620 [Pseudomonadota bacterium]
MAELGAGTAIPVDMVRQSEVALRADAMRDLVHLVISASSAAHGRFSELSEEDLRHILDAKFFGPYAIAKAALIRIRP